MSTVRPISEKQIEANRRNARQSTGPKTEAGKQASRFNAVTHGLLAKGVVITAGDYQEDEQEFAQLLDDLREQFTPVGVAEDLEVQKIALCYWRKMRAVRYEHGAIRKRTGDLREREELKREDSFHSALRLGFDLERSSRGIQYLIDGLEETKQEVLDGTLPKESREWLEQHFPDVFTPPDETRVVGQAVAGKGGFKGLRLQDDGPDRRAAAAAVPVAGAGRGGRGAESRIQDQSRRPSCSPGGA